MVCKASILIHDGLLSKYTEYYWLMMPYKLQAKYADSRAKYTDSWWFTNQVYWLMMVYKPSTLTHDSLQTKYATHDKKYVHKMEIPIHS